MYNLARIMSGHSKWSTIKRKKEVTDKSRGKLFSKLANGISLAIKTGGGNNPDINFRLRIAIEAAKTANMPKSNITRALAKGESGEALMEGTYEGFGPSGISVIVEVATTNKNRTAQILKTIFDRGGGNLAGPGAVSFNFEKKGLMLVKKREDTETQMLELIDLGVEDVQETDDGLEVYVDPGSLRTTREKLESAGFSITNANLWQKPKTLLTIDDKDKAQKALSFLETLDEQDDVQKVFTNLDIHERISDEVLK